MDEIPTVAAVTAGVLMSTPVVAVTVDHSLAAAWRPCGSEVCTT